METHKDLSVSLKLLLIRIMNKFYNFPSSSSILEEQVESDLHFMLGYKSNTEI